MNFDIAGLYQYYLQNPTYPYQQEGIETLKPILPLQQTINTDQGSDDTDTDITKTTKTTPYTGQPIRFRDVANLVFNPIYGLPNLMARSQGYTNPFDWAKKAMGIEEKVIDPGVPSFIAGGDGSGGSNVGETFTNPDTGQQQTVGFGGTFGRI